MKYSKIASLALLAMAPLAAADTGSGFSVGIRAAAYADHSSIDNAAAINSSGLTGAAQAEVAFDYSYYGANSIYMRAGFTTLLNDFTVNTDRSTPTATVNVEMVSHTNPTGGGTAEAMVQNGGAAGLISVTAGGTAITPAFDTAGGAANTVAAGQNAPIKTPAAGTTGVAATQIVVTTGDGADAANGINTTTLNLADASPTTVEHKSKIGLELALGYGFGDCGSAVYAVVGFAESTYDTTAATFAQASLTNTAATNEDKIDEVSYGLGVATSLTENISISADFRNIEHKNTVTANGGTTDSLGATIGLAYALAF